MPLTRRKTFQRRAHTQVSLVGALIIIMAKAKFDETHQVRSDNKILVAEGSSSKEWNPRHIFCVTQNACFKRGNTRVFYFCWCKIKYASICRHPPNDSESLPGWRQNIVGCIFELDIQRVSPLDFRSMKENQTANFILFHNGRCNTINLVNQVGRQD